MTDLPKRELGRTGMHTTMLGYGAMELRGAPRAREVTEAQAETIELVASFPNWPNILQYLQIRPPANVLSRLPKRPLTPARVGL